MARDLIVSETTAMVFGVDRAASAEAVQPAGETDAASVAAADVDPTSDGDDQPDTPQFKVSGDLEDQTLPAPLATLPLDWQPFPHLYPHVSDGTSAFIDVLRPPPPPRFSSAAA